MKIILFAVFAIVMIAVAIASQSKKIRSVKAAPPNYKKKAILTDNEAEFFGRLRTALPEHLIFPQVSMAALLEPVGNDAKIRYSAQLRINQKRVDYAIYDQALSLLCIVELDDKTHSASKDRERDSFFTGVGIRTIRWQSRNKPAPEEIREKILLQEKNEPNTLKGVISSQKHQKIA